MAARTTDDGYTMDAAGTAAYFTAMIDHKADLEQLVIRDHGDGSLTITQPDTPIVGGAEVTLTTAPDLQMTYDDTNAITVSGTFVAGQTMSFDLFGEKVSFVTSSDDGFEDTLAGVAIQMAAAINNAGISGVTAAETTGANSVMLTSDVNLGNAVTNSGTQFIITTIGDAATSSIAISGTDVAVGSATAATYTDGGVCTFEVAGHELSLVVSTSDGYTDDAAGVANQMFDLVQELGLEGINMTWSLSRGAAGPAQINITRALTGTVNGGSTVVTNISSLSQSELGDPSFSGSIDVPMAAASTDAIIRLCVATQTLTAQRANLGALYNRFDSTVSNLTHMTSNLEAGRGRI